MRALVGFAKEKGIERFREGLRGGGGRSTWRGIKVLYVEVTVKARVEGGDEEEEEEGGLFTEVFGERKRKKNVYQSGINVESYIRTH